MSAKTTQGRIGIYPGTFDPVTLGHADIIRRGSKLVDTLIVGVTTNPSKNPMFTPDERIAMMRAEVERLALDNVEIQGFDALLMKFADHVGAGVIIRGLRAVADFEYEYQMAGMNQQIDDSIETVFLMADISLQPIASKLVKEIALYGGDITPFVAPPVKARVEERVAEIGRKGEY
ncbi:pantetheine-phosphate adenylyltransferase [Aurantiacibacter aquimixticola]|uniref:Phosphopantetheine adenylyltransferase n=1 Tax=Aurantiacibacter aquimixticola TaxID=1958945 RepID=A0A419RRI3_9SPHN|nr:pantetheine-phosphate adenylyltransferase [Aurantiacibacter aquimixticola]RJY08398.1 pantetheine-phosphate adenylyltransferase [Aurantiacibacter aquimixticola]